MPKQPRRPRQPRDGRASAPRLNRVLIFTVLCVACVLLIGGYAFISLQRATTAASGPAGDTPASADVLASVVAQPHLVFLHSPTGDAYRRVAIVPLDAPDGPRYLTPLQCQRVYFQANQGLCLGKNYVAGVGSSYDAFNFDDRFQVGATYDDPGQPIRVRLSNDGRLGAMTVFVTGHSYADASFSTQTSLVDMHAGQLLADLEKFTIERDGAAFQSVDFNFWGVTF